MVLSGKLEIILASFLASFSGRFGAFSTALVRFFPSLFRPKTGHLEGFGSKNVFETLRPYFEEDTQRYQSVKKPGQTDTNSSWYGPFLVQKMPFYIGIEKLFRSSLL